MRYVQPHIGYRVFFLFWWVDSLTIEWLKCRSLAIQLRGHKHILVVHNEMHKTVARHMVMWVTVVLVLIYAVGIFLVGAFIFQFKCEQRYTVQQNAHVQFVAAIFPR